MILHGKIRAFFKEALSTLSQDTGLTRDQATGCYIGAAVGDAYGVPFEFMSPEQIIRSGFKGGPRYYEGGAHNATPGEWSDDTSMSRVIAHCYLMHHKLDADSVMSGWSDWMHHGYMSTRPHCWDIGMQTSTEISAYWNDTTHLIQYGPGRGQGNGGIMRLAAVITANSQNMHEAVNDALFTSNLTHRHWKCEKYAEMLVEACFGMEPEWEEEWGFKAGGGHVRDTFLTAYQAFETTDNFMDCIEKAVSYGGDTDTVGCVAGMLAGAHYGASEIPMELMDELHSSLDIQAEALALYSFSRGK